MSKPIISVEDLYKGYRLGGKEELPDTLISSILGAVKAPLQAWNQLRATGEVKVGETGENLLWALNGVSFDVYDGDVVGFIGNNGAGKSTLLKILSRITFATSGKITTIGRISSLLEVGTGFHPELTGRENIYMNGTILGMRKHEIDRKFDAIVEFSGVSKFLDTPTKRYSSGMQIRLAFAVAAHLEPDILIVDEVLAVGDIEFQSKCIGKMQEVSRSGRTVLFVSHNLAAMQSLCNRGIVLAAGKVTFEGNIRDAVSNYLDKTSDGCNSIDLQHHNGRQQGAVKLMQRAELRDGIKSVNVIETCKPLTVNVEFNSEKALRPILGVVVKDLFGNSLFGLNNRVIRCESDPGEILKGRISCNFKSIPLLPGKYLIDLYLGDIHKDFDVIRNALSFQVIEADIYGTGKLPPPSAGSFLAAASFLIDTL